MADQPAHLTSARQPGGASGSVWSWPQKLARDPLTDTVDLNLRWSCCLRLPVVNFCSLYYWLISVHPLTTADRAQLVCLGAPQQLAKVLIASSDIDDVQVCDDRLVLLVFVVLRRSVWRGHPYEIFKRHQCKCTARSSFFSERIVDIWNTLPLVKLIFLSLVKFKRSMKLLDFSQYLVCS